MIDKVVTAVYRKDYKLIKKLVSEGADLKETDDDGRNALMHAILAEDTDPQMVKFLIDLGANVNLHDNGQEWTALHFAARDQRQDIVKVLLESGADPNATECFGNTPIARCLDKSSVNMDIIKLLLRYGADSTIKNNYGNSPIDTAKLMGNEELVNVLDV